MRDKPDRIFFLVIVALAMFGFFIFSSASLGLLSREGANFNVIALKQLGILLAGFIAFLGVSKMEYRFWRDHSLTIFIIAVIATFLVFVPGLGFSSGGASRWIHIGRLTIQPSELLKLGYVFYLAAWFAKVKDGVRTFRQGLLPFFVISGIVSIVMIAQPDIDTLVIMFAAGIAMFYVSGARWREIGAIALLVLVGIGVLALYKPYIKSRVLTFFNPDRSPQGASYQITQSLIAIGSGGLTGRGFGQSIQKFKYLPEPIGDSVFSVASEEFGFVGSIAIIAAFLVFALSGFRIANRAPTQFGRLVTVGIVIMIMTGTFINIASMLGIIPLTGTPLLFVSHGGTALLFALIEAGIILNVSRHQKKENLIYSKS